MTELERLQEKTVGMLEAAIQTTKHRPESSSVAAGWAKDAALELYRYMEAKPESTPKPQPESTPKPKPQLEITPKPKPQLAITPADPDPTTTDDGSAER